MKDTWTEHMQDLWGYEQKTTAGGIKKVEQEFQLLFPDFSSETEFAISV